MCTVLQVYNSGHIDLERPHFLPLMDRNLYLEVYDHDSETDLNSISPVTVEYSSIRFNCADLMFTSDGNTIIINRAGLYEISYKFNVGSGSVAGSTSVSTWLEQDIGGAGYNEVAGSRSYGYAPPSPGWNNVFSKVTLFLQTPDIPSTFRMVAQVISPAGTPTAQVSHYGRIFRTMNIIGLS